MTTKLYGTVSAACLSEIRCYVRETGIERPKIDRLPGPALTVPMQRFPVVVFTFSDFPSAFAFRMSFNLRVFSDTTLDELEAERREKIIENMKRMGAPPEIEARMIKSMITGQMLEA